MTHNLDLSAQETNNSPWICYFYIYPSWYFSCLESSFSQRVSRFHKLPSLLHDISSRCVMWEVVLILLLTCFYKALWNSITKCSRVELYPMLQSHLSPQSLLGHSLEEHFPLSTLTRQVWRTAGSVLPALVAMSNARQLASEHSSWGPSASWEIWMEICLLKLLVGCLLFLPALKEQPVIPGIPTITSSSSYASAKSVKGIINSNW